MRQVTMILFVVLAGALSVGLFWLKVQVQDLEAERARLERAIVSERQAIRVLKAEWSLLNDPARLRGLADKHLGLGPVEAAQIAQIDDLPVAADDGPKQTGRTVR
jgi:cell division protein FtsL